MSDRIYVRINGTQWEYIPEHDEQGKAIPESWDHEFLGRVWSIEEARLQMKYADE